ncbi:MAG: 4'-phosphopantetheinyl transferase superfamily protein [Halobacteriovoraceae bacterium]|jgi:enterobactin synthetase component D|nr:4'-phosphopantetheinyl transferase superfamily protein [Halobacteriovoraceae bacterium]
MNISRLETDNDFLWVNYTTKDISPEDFRKYAYILPTSMGKAIDAKKYEFILGRLCSQKDLDNIYQIDKGLLGEPVFPTGIKGSISHSKDFVISVVSEDQSIRSLGIDIERCVDEKRMDVIKKMALTDEEISYLDGYQGDKLRLATIIFSAKETLFKLLNPLCETYINFHEGIFSNFDEKKQQFEIRLVSDKPKLKTLLGVYSGEVFRVGNNFITLLCLQK